MAIINRARRGGNMQELKTRRKSCLLFLLNRINWENVENHTCSAPACAQATLLHSAFSHFPHIFRIFLYFIFMFMMSTIRSRTMLAIAEFAYPNKFYQFSFSSENAHLIHLALLCHCFLYSFYFFLPKMTPEKTSICEWFFCIYMCVSSRFCERMTFTRQK